MMDRDRLIDSAVIEAMRYPPPGGWCLDRYVYGCDDCFDQIYWHVKYNWQRHVQEMGE